MPQSERRLAAIMFTDMIGYTALGQKNESLSLALVEEHRKLIRPIFARHSGREIKTMGDAFLVEFSNALDGVRCAYDIQRAAREFNVSLPDEKRIHLRVGVHLGDVVESQGDISGDAVNVASRIESLAEDGGVCLTRQVYDHVENKFELPLVSLGSKSLKNVSAPLEVYKMVMPWREEKETSSTRLDRRRIAILPFVSMSPDPNDEYFADGMTEELISTTSSITDLTLIARTSVMSYKRTSKKIREIGSELEAGTILEGSVRKAGNRLRITVQLIDVQSQGHLWAQSYDRNLDDVFAVQSDIAKRVADALRVRMLPSAKEGIERVPTKNTEAHVLYLKGRQYWNERSLPGLRKAIQYFKKATEKDPNYAAAYAGLAQCHAVMARNGLEEPGPNIARLKEYTGIALKLDQNLAEAHASQAAVSDFEHDLKRSEEEFRRAIELNPSYATAHQWYGNLLGFLGRGSESYAELRRALDLDPFSPMVNVNYGDYFRKITREYGRAVEQYRKALEISPGFRPALWEMIFTYSRNSMFDEALETLDEYSKIAEEGWTKLGRAFVYAHAQRQKESRRLLSEVISGLGREYVSPYYIALIYFAMGENDEGFEWLNKGFDSYDTLMDLQLDPELDGVRTDARYISLQTKMGFTRN